MPNPTYREHTASVDTTGSSANYVPMHSFDMNFPSIPYSSQLKLAVAPGTEKYWNASRDFAHRLDSERVEYTARPIVIGGNGGSSPNYFDLDAAFKINGNGNGTGTGNGAVVVPAAVIEQFKRRGRR